MGKKRVEKGITLIALIVTIVVLLILAAVAISSITNDGIITKAQSAANKYEIAQEKEKLQMEVLEWSLTNDNGIPTLENYLSGIYGEENVQLNVDNSITVTVPSGNKYVVTEDGSVTLIDGTVEEPEPVVPEIILDKTNIAKEIESGSTATESITATLKNASGNLTWTSSDTSVAEVSGSENTRTITLKKEGTATITVSYGEYSATCIVSVTEKKALISFTINETIYYAEEGMTWKSWCESSYNTDGFYYSSSQYGWIFAQDGGVVWSEAGQPCGDDNIEKDTTFELV